MVFTIGCTSISTDKPVFGKPTVTPWGWDNPLNGWCLRHPEDIDCIKGKAKIK